MSFLDFFRDKMAGNSQSISDLATSLEPASLPSHVRTLDKLVQYRTDLAEIYEATRPGPDGARQAVGLQIACADELSLRLRLVQAMRGAAAKRVQDKADSEKRLSAAEKAVKAHQITHASAIAEYVAVAERLAVLRSAHDALAAASVAHEQDAKARVSAAVLAGDATAEEAAARDLAAQQLNQGPTAPEQRALSIRIDEVGSLCKTKHSAATAAEEALNQVQREQCTAEIELAAVGYDEATDAYALRLFDLLCVAEGARTKGFDDLAKLRGLGATRIWVHDYRRTWFSPEDSRLVGGHVEMLGPLQTLVRMVQGDQFNPAPLALDLRHDSTATPAAAALAQQPVRAERGRLRA